MFDLAIYNRLKSGGHIAVELNPTSDQNRRWVAIYKPKLEPINKNVPEHVYSILDFEVRISVLDEYFGPDDVLNKKRYYANSEEELIDTLLDLRIDPKTFTYPWRCDYPL